MGWRLPAGHPFQKHYATPSTDRSGAVKLAAPAMRRWVPELDSFYIEARERNPKVAILRALRRHRVAQVLAVLALVATTARRIE